MKLNLDIKNKKGSFEADVEKIVEKEIDNHEKDWKEKFKTKHEAKKELIEIKHKNKMEHEEQKANHKNWFERRAEEKSKIKELELKKEMMELEKLEKSIRNKTIVSSILIVVGVISIILGYFLGYASGDGNSPWFIITLLGFFGIAMGIWLFIDINDNKKSRSYKK